MQGRLYFLKKKDTFWICMSFGYHDPPYGLFKYLHGFLTVLITSPEKDLCVVKQPDHTQRKLPGGENFFFTALILALLCICACFYRNLESIVLVSPSETDGCSKPSDVLWGVGAMIIQGDPSLAYTKEAKILQPGPWFYHELWAIYHLSWVPLIVGKSSLRMEPNHLAGWWAHLCWKVPQADAGQPPLEDDLAFLCQDGQQWCATSYQEAKYGPSGPLCLVLLTTHPTHKAMPPHWSCSTASSSSFASWEGAAEKGLRLVSISHPATVLPPLPVS